MGKLPERYQAVIRMYYSENLTMREIGDALVRHPLVRKISFTGSTEIGARIMALAAPQIKRVSLELGGKSANVIFDDANLDAAAKAAAAGIFFNAGQVCSAGSRVLVQEGAYDEVVERLAARAQGFAQCRLAQRKFSRLRRLHADLGVRGRSGRACRHKPRETRRDHVRRSRAVALPSLARRRRSQRTGHNGYRDFVRSQLARAQADAVRAD